MNLRASLHHLMITVLLACAALMAGCSSGSTPSSGSSLSPSVVSGVAASGAPLSGKVYLKDSSAHEKSTDIAPATGAFAIDVSDMKAPFMLRATGSAGEKLYSFASGPGTANINPLTSAIVASAAGVADPTSIYDAPDSNKFKDIDTKLSTATSALQTRLSPLLTIFGAAAVNPIKDHYEANHQGLDGMFDNVKISTASNSIEITNKNDDTKVIFSGNLSDDKNDVEDNTKLPQPSGLPAAPSHVAAMGGSNQVTVSWDGVSDATSYNIYWSTTTGVTKTNGSKISSVRSPYVQTGLTAGTTYYYIVTAVNSKGEGPASMQVSATTLTTTPAVPAAPTGVAATGGTNQVTITWGAVPGATSYNIYWSTTSGVTIAKGTKIANATSPAVHSGLSASTTYYYIVTAVNSAGESLPSVQVSATTAPS
ncbi:MAG TPA: fibronectin type III domain-containing protein, partial [Desulfuromonadaceae bacterium]